MNTNIVRVISEGIQEALANARAALLNKEISQEQFQDVYDSCYHSFLDALAEQKQAERKQG